jgi:hypothetical protein
MNKNLAVYMLFHTSNEHGKKTYEAIYKLLCRDADHPFEDGLDIPVYLRMGDDDEHKVIKTIDPKASDKTYILLLIDDNMYCSEVWSEYVKQLISIRDANKGTFIINCVEQSKFALDFNKSLARDQFIRLNSYSLLENWQEFQIRLFDNLIRFIKLKDRTKKLKIFISHSKRDENKIGLLKAIEFRDYIRSQTKLDSFFDASDILDGENAQDQIKKNEEGIQSLIVILNSNTYSEREWCQKEVLFAKESKIPTIAVSLLDGEVKRSFPYISNIPYIRYDNNWGDILVLILRTALDQYCQAEYLENLRLGLEKDKRDSYAVLPFSPEAYSFVYKELQKNILYPEPPLTKDELNVVKTIAGVEKQFLTPMQLLAETINLARKSVAVSVSEAPGSYSIGYGKAMIRDLTIELSRHLLIAGARMVYGGDLRSEGFTELFSELSLQYKNYQSEVDREEFFFTNYFAWPIWLNLTNEHKLQFVNSRVKYKTVEPPEDYMGDPSKPIAPINNENTLVWAKSLRKMRMEMESHVDARIILGGKIQGFKGYMAGLAEEFVQSFRAGHPVYLLGGFGGTAAMLADILQGKADVSALVNASRKNKPYNDFFEYCKSKGIDMGYAELEDIVKAGGLDVLDNGLSREKNMSLLTSTDVIEIVGLILEGLRNKFNKSISNDEK